MTLRIKIPLLVALTIFLMVVLVYSIGSKILMDGFLKGERDNVLYELDRVGSALDSEIHSVTTLGKDYAGWDETYSFVVDKNPLYLKQNYDSQSFYGIKLNLVAIVNTSHEVVYGKGYDWRQRKDEPLPEDFIETLKAANFLDFKDADDGKAGIVTFPSGPLLIISNPILTSNFHGPIRGAHIFGRQIDKEVVKNLSDFMKLTVSTVAGIDPGDLAALYKDSYVTEDGLKIVSPVNHDFVQGFLTLSDVKGNPVVALSIVLPRTIYLDGLTSLLLMLFVLIGAGVIMSLLSIMIINRFVINRLTRLSQNVSHVPANRHYPDYFLVTGKDEISMLSKVFASAYEKLFLSKRVIALEREKLDFILESISDAVIAIDSSRKILLVNRSAELLTGCTREELLGKPYGEVLKFYCEKTNAPVDDFFSAFESKIPVHRHLQAIYLRQKGGREISISESVAAVKASHNNVVGYVMVLRDVGSERLIELERVKNEFLSIASHQLRTPLGIMKWTLELLMNGDAGKLNPKQMDLFKNLVKNNERMILLISDFLGILDIQLTENPLLEKEKFSLEKIISGVISIQKKIYPTKRIIFDESWPKNKIYIVGDRPKLNKVFSNLIGNVLKYLIDEKEITMGYRKTGKEIIVSINNLGTLIPQNDRKRIFSKYFRMENIQEHIPIGFGLALFGVRSIIEAHNGRVWFESPEKKGLTFCLALPCDVNI